MHAQAYLSKVQLLLCLIVCFFCTVQAAYAQNEGMESTTPLLNNCSPIPATNCQIQLITNRPLTTTVTYWKIQLGEDEPFSPNEVQVEGLPGSIAIVVDASDVMRSEAVAKPSLLTQISTLINELSEKLLAANAQITKEDLTQLYWTIFFIGAADAGELYTWCDTETQEFKEIYCSNNNIWIKDSNLPGNVVNGFSQKYQTDSNLGATPFFDPLTIAITSFQGRHGPKQLICFCEGLDGGAQLDDVQVGNLVQLANANQVRIHVAHMWKAEGKDATTSLARLAKETGGEFVAVGGEITSIWQAITQETMNYQVTLTIPLLKQTTQLQVKYQGDNGSEISWPALSLPLDTVVKPSESNISINGQSIDLTISDQVQQIVIAPNATGIDIQIAGDGRMSIDLVKIENKSWTVGELKNISITDLFSTTDKPITLSGELTVIDSASGEISLPLSLAIELPASPLPLLELATDQDGYVVVSTPENGTQAAIPILIPDNIGYDLKPQSLTCEILGVTTVDIPNPSDMHCVIPIDEILDRESQLLVTLKDQFGFEYSGQAPLRLANPIFEPTPTPAVTEVLTAAVNVLVELPQWLWGSIGVGIIIAAVIAVVFFNRKHKPDFEPDDEATERVSAGNFFPPTPLSSRTDVTERLSHVLPVAKLILKHAPVEDRSVLAPDITLYPNTLKWGIGREESKLLVEPEYRGAEPIEIKAKSISRVQARLEFHIDVESFFLIGDMAANGTYINRTKLDPLEPYPLHAGDEVQFGKIAYEFKILEMNLQEAFSEFATLPNKEGTVIKNTASAKFNQTEK